MCLAADDLSLYTIYVRGLKSAVANIFRKFTHASDIGEMIDNVLQYILIGDYDNA